MVNLPSFLSGILFNVMDSHHCLEPAFSAISLGSLIFTSNTGNLASVGISMYMRTTYLLFTRLAVTGIAKTLRYCFGFTIHFAVKGSHSAIDRKSTRLNSSHVRISYAVF